MNLTDKQKEQNVAALRALMDGKPIECIASSGGIWVDAGHLKVTGFDYRAFNYRPKPAPVWTLPAPPAGRRWHREDWSADMLPDGWRPLLLGETPEKGDEFYSDANHWTVSLGTGTIEHTNKYRTHRPLPSAPVTRPWASPDDVPGPVCWIRRESSERMVLALDEDSVVVGSWIGKDGVTIVRWAELSKWTYSTDRKEWKPCTVTE